MTELELLEVLRDLYENYIPVNFNSLLNTLKLCDDIVEYYVSSTTHSFYNNEPCYCINIYASREENKKIQCGNLWVGFGDSNNVYILQYYNMERTDKKYNINRAGINKDEYNNIIAVKMQKSIRWKRNLVIGPGVKISYDYRGEFD